MASLVALVHTIINFVICLLKLICLDNQSPRTNVFKLELFASFAEQFIMVL